jgi:hypothetical protein
MPQSYLTGEKTMNNQLLRLVRFSCSPATNHNKNNTAFRKISCLIHASVLLLLASCGGSSSPYIPVTYTSAVSQVTIKGDSMAAGVDSLGNLTQYWLQWNTTVENDGIPGADLNYLINNTVEHRSLETVELWAGYNTLKHPEISVDTALAEYSAYINKLTFSKLICVGVPYNTTMDNARVDSFNNGVKARCPHFVDVSDLTTIDGVHLTPGDYMIAGERIKNLL